MKRTCLSLLSILAFALAGSVMAQTDYGSTDPLGDTPPSTTAVDSDTQPGTADTQSGSSTGDPMYQDAPSQMEGSSPQPSSAAEAPTHESLPATASPLPLAFAIGVFALGATAALRAYRLRSPH